MDKNVEAQQIANKYLENEISNLQVQIQSLSKGTIENIKEGFLIELEILEECFESGNYSHINNIINDLLSEEFKLNTKHSSYKTLRCAFFQARIEAAQVMIKICEGPVSYKFKGEDIDLITSLMKFFAKPPSTDNWKPGSLEMRNQVLVNELGNKIRNQSPRTNKTDLAKWIADEPRMQNSDKPLAFETIRRNYLDDF